jgi:O-antigen/teichoic acid export membrane protein
MHVDADRDAPITVAEEAHDRQRRGTRQLLLARGVFFVAAYAISAMLARALGPTDYGIYGVILSQLLWLEMVVNAGIPAATAKLVADGRHDPDDVERSARTLLLGVSGVVLVAGWSLASAVAPLMQIPNGATLLRIAVLDLPFAALYASYEGIFAGHRRFGAMAMAQVAQALARVTAVSALIVIGFSIEGALVALVLSSVALCLGLTAWYPPKGLGGGRGIISEIVRFTGPLALCLISGQVLLNLDLWSLQGLWTGSGEVVGQYVASLNLARILAVIPTVQASVLFTSVAWAAASHDNARAVRHIQEASRFAIVIATAACVILGMNGAEILGLLFSSAYAEGKRFLPLQLAGFGLFALLDVFANGLMAAGRHRVVAVVLTATVPLVWLSNYALIPQIGPVGAAISLVVGVAVGAAVTGVLVYRHFGMPIRIMTVTRVLAASAIVSLASAALPVGGPLVLVKVAGLGGLFMLTLYLLGEVTPQDFGLTLRSRRTRPW